MWRYLKHFLFWIWPPYESLLTDRAMDKQIKEESDDVRWEAILSSVRHALPTQPERLPELETFSLQIQKAESERFDTIDNKGATFIAGIGIATSLISIGPVFLAGEHSIHNSVLVWLAGTIYVCAIVFFLNAVYFAIKVRHVTAFVCHSADTFLDALRDNGARIDERIVFNIAAAKWNERLMTKKTNYLSVVESLFIRGLFLLAVAAILSFVAIGVN